MATKLLSNLLAEYYEKNSSINELAKREPSKGALEVFGKFIYDLYIPDSWNLNEIERIDNHTIIFHWVSVTIQAECPTCKEVSIRRCKTYKSRKFQDLPMSGITVYHTVKLNRYFCDTSDSKCNAKTFIEQFYDIVEKDARLSNRLKDFVVRQAIESSCNGMVKPLKQIGIIISRYTIIREVKKKGAVVVANNLKRNDVKVLSVDDINLRKGNSSTACSVFIDAETHRVLVIVEGANSERAESVMKCFPSATMVSRDRDSAYSTAAKKCNKTDSADRFHLIQNIHKTVKDTLSLEISGDLFVREGNGWLRMVNGRNVESESAINDIQQDDSESLVVIKPAILAEEDIERRIHLAGINQRASKKYKKTISILELTESGLRTSEIARRLNIKVSEVLNYRKTATETVENVELKIDEYYQMQLQGKWEYHQKTIAKKARPSSESIVKPYEETVLRMFNEGKNHRNIYPVLVQEGYTGSKNAIYQFIIKYAHENNIPYGRNSRVIPLEERDPYNITPRPERISIERVSKKTIYQSILQIAAKRKEEIKQYLLDEEEISSKNIYVGNNNNTINNETIKNNNLNKSEEWINKTNYDESIAKIVFNTTQNKKNEKKN
jgi:hypothetical protein